MRDAAARTEIAARAEHTADGPAVNARRYGKVQL